MRFDPIIEKPYMVTGLWHHFAVHLFQGKVTLGDMDVIETQSAIAHGRLKAKLVELVVILPSKADMTHAERVRMGRVIKRWEDKRVASATVILAEGLIASIHRSVLTGLQLLVPPPHPTKVFGTLPDAIRFLLPFVEEVSAGAGEQATAEALVKAIDDVFVRFEARSTRAPG